MAHARDKSKLTIVIRNRQGVIIKDETFNLVHTLEREPMATGFIRGRSGLAKALSLRLPIPHMHFALSK